MESLLSIKPLPNGEWLVSDPKANVSVHGTLNAATDAARAVATETHVSEILVRDRYGRCQSIRVATIDTR